MPALEGRIRNGHPKQKLLELGDASQGDPLLKDTPLYRAGPLLAQIEPVVFYSPGRKMVELEDRSGKMVKFPVAFGPVDFSLLPLTAVQTARLMALPNLIAAETDPERLSALEAEQDQLQEHKEAARRAGDYREHAKKNPELMHQIRLDSLYPYLLQNKIDIKNFREKFVYDWLVARRDILLPALKAIGVDAGARYPDAARDEMAARLVEDLLRSRALWLAYQENKQREAAAEEESRAQRRVAELVQKPMTIGADPGIDFTVLARAIEQRHVPYAAPRIRISTRKVQTDRPGVVEYHPDVRVSADPEIFVPPYSSTTFALSPALAQAAAASRSIRGIPIHDDALIMRLAQFGRSKLKAGDPALVTFVFCKDFKIPARVVPETTADLPRLGKEVHPVTGETVYLFSGGGQTPTVEDTATIVVKGKEVGKDTIEAGSDGTWMRFQIALQAKGVSLPPETPFHLLVTSGGYREHVWAFAEKGFGGPLTQ